MVVILGLFFGFLTFQGHLHLVQRGDRGTLLLLSQSSTSLKSKIAFHLKTLNPQFYQIPAEITADLLALHRHALYTSGKAFFITPRILIVDLLTNKLPTSKIAGIIILNAHSLSETSTEAFIVRIFRSLNRGAYVRALSDKPHAMVSGFAKEKRTMKCLHVRKLYLWPRFQVYVSQELERDPPEVVDIRVPMSRYMVGIQKAIAETNKVDVEDSTVENGLFKSFDEIVRRQLDPIWHTLGKKTKQLVSDLKTLRKLLDYLSASDIGDDVTPNSIISKLSLLALHFPRLRIIWSRSLHATAEIFASLKANQDEPDETKAIRVGVPSEEGIVENDVRAENYNTSAVEFLRRLPGVTDSNYRAIMDGLGKLAELMGGHKAARTLRDFLDAKYPTLL
uniref:ERCC4 domain-containing protein n=1 Tax=Glycine max TaxID=3847 RepID=K7K4W9_SOYBN